MRLSENSWRSWRSFAGGGENVPAALTAEVLGVPLWVLLVLALVAAAAGWIDAVSGGGGMLQLPALLVLLPGVPVAQALGTNKLSSIIGTSAAATTYARRFRPDPATAVPMVIGAIIGAGIGAYAASGIPQQVFRPIVLLMLIGIWVWTLVKPGMGARDEERWSAPKYRRHRLVVSSLGGLGIGLYDGAFGPGTGSFLLILLVAGLGLSFLHASATAKLVNLSTNAAALAVFASTGSVLWAVGLVMGLCNLSGAVLGARTAIARGSGFVRVVFLVIVGLLICRLAWEVLGTL